MKPTNLLVSRRNNRWVLTFEFNGGYRIRELRTPFLEKPIGNDLIEVTQGLGLTTDEALDIPLEV